MEPRVRILCVEDEPGVRAVLRSVLTKAGYDVLEARDGIEAVSVLDSAHEEIQLLVTDIRMPRMDGLELARIVGERYPRVPVLFISGYPFEIETEKKKRPEQACGFVPKPFRPMVLLEAVRKCLESPEQALRTSV
jgi:CheY-like chemotaxis protein